jgi:hypothetical protein
MRKLLYLIVLFAALFIFNPGEEEFADHVEKRSGEYLSTRAGEGRLGEILADLGADVTKALANHVTRRENYYLFSIYTIDLDGPEESAEEWRILGVLGKFVTLSEPEGFEE